MFIVYINIVLGGKDMQKEINENPSFGIIFLILLFSYFGLKSILGEIIMYFLIGELIFLVGVNAVIVDIRKIKAKKEEYINKVDFVMVIMGIIVMLATLSGNFNIKQLFIVFWAAIWFCVSIFFIIKSTTDLILMKSSTLEIEAVCIAHKESVTRKVPAAQYRPLTGRGGVTVYAPVFQFVYQGQTYEVCNEVYGNNRLEVGNTYMIKINPKHPDIFYDQKSYSKLISILIVSIFMILIGILFITIIA